MSMFFQLRIRRVHRRIIFGHDTCSRRESGTAAWLLSKRSRKAFVPPNAAVVRRIIILFAQDNYLRQRSSLGSPMPVPPFLAGAACSGRLVHLAMPSPRAHSPSRGYAGRP
jgi:hypothetical protein